MTPTQAITKKFTQTLARMATFGVISLAPISTPVFAQSDPAQEACKGITATGAGCGGDSQGTISDTIGTVVEILLFIVGIAAVVMLIVGGLRYITSAGDAQAAANARNTILYSIIGLVVAILGYALVQYVFNAVS